VYIIVSVMCEINMHIYYTCVFLKPQKNLIYDGQKKLL
jgi:hypothetical protein